MHGIRIQPNFRQGKLPGDPRYASVYYDMSKGDDMRGPWNEGSAWQFDAETQPAMDGGDGTAQVSADKQDLETLKALAGRTASATNIDPATGADLGSRAATTAKGLG